MMKETINNVTIYSGYCKDLIDEIQKIMNFKYEIYEAPDGRYGNLNDDGTWNGMINELIKGVCFNFIFIKEVFF